MWLFSPTVSINENGVDIKIHNKKEALFYVQQCEKIAKESAKLVNTTKKPDVFFSRYQLLIEELTKMSKLEVFRCFKNKPSKDLENVFAKRELTINDFIDRYYQDTLEKIKNLKTINAKEKRINEFENNFNYYKQYLNENNIKYFSNKCLKLKKENV